MSAIEAITVPKWGLTMTEGTVSQWLVDEGAEIQVGDEILDMETSKITNTVEAIVAGKLRRIVAQPGETLEIAALLGVVAGDDIPESEVEAFITNYVPEGVASTDVVGAANDSPVVPKPEPEPIAQAPVAESPSALAALAAGEDDSGVAASNHARRLAAEHKVNLHNVTATGRHGRVSREDVIAAINAAGGSVSEPDAATGTVTQSLPSTADDSRVKATPVARRLAKELGINLHDCRASGTRGRVCKADVEAANSLRNGTPATEAVVANDPVPVTPAFDELPMNAMRRTIGARLQASKQSSPHFRVAVDVELDNLLSLRKQINAENPGVKVSVNDFVIKACAMALVKVPDVNVQFDEASQTIRRFKDADISVAVAIDGGLITPIVKAANRNGLTEISKTMRELSTKAKANMLMPEEFQGGTFSISNLGMYGVKQFDAIINPPQGAILAVGGGEQRPVVRNGELRVATVMTLSLSSDHRVIDGALAAQFLQELKRFIEHPALMIV